MKTRKSFLKNPLVIASLGCLMAFAAACGDDDDSGPAPSGGTKNTGGSAGKNSTAGEGGTGATAGKSTTGGTNSMAGVGNESAMGGAGAGPVMPEGGMAGAGGAADCVDKTDMGCYSCKPKTLTQFLNACPTTGCEPFDNSKLTSIKAGKLPDLP